MNWVLTSAVGLFGLLTLANLRMFGSLFNPMYLTFAIEFFLRTLFGYVAYYYVFPAGMSDPDYLDLALLLSMLYAVAYFGGLWFRNQPLEGLFTRLAGASITSSDERAAGAAIPSALLVLLVGLGALAVLAVAGGGGALWLTDPRAAYGSYRSGAGIFWSIFASSIPLSALVLVHLRRARFGLAYLPVAAAYVVLAYFSGSKQTILSVVLGLLFYRHYFVKPISTLRLGTIFGVLFVGFFLTTVLQGSFESVFEAISYVDYMNMSAKYLDLAPLLSEIQGQGVVSYLWSFVPRALVPGKPFEYGIVLINSYLFPGAAEEGYTPAYLEWTLFHMDFGVVGVALLGFLKGQFVASLFRAFERSPDNLFLFLFTCHLGFMVFNVPGVYEFAFLLSLGVAYALKRLAGLQIAV